MQGADYFELLKPRVMSLAIFTAIIGLLLAPGYIHPMLAIFSIIAIGAGAGAAGAINMWYDHDMIQSWIEQNYVPCLQEEFYRRKLFH